MEDPVSVAGAVAVAVLLGGGALRLAEAAVKSRMNGKSDEKGASRAGGLTLDERDMLRDLHIQVPAVLLEIVDVQKQTALHQQETTRLLGDIDRRTESCPAGGFPGASRQ